MKERIRAVGFYARGETRFRSVCRDTLAGSLGLQPHHIPAGLHAWPGIRSIVHEEFRVLSYVLDWKDAFSQCADLEVEWCNVNNLLEFARGLRKVGEYPLSIVLHSAAWDHLRLLRLAQGRFRRRKGTLLLFYGNEYHNMSEKIAFARTVGADYIASQLPLPSAEWLYAECDRSVVLPAPAALNPHIYKPDTTVRHVDIGFRGDIYKSPFALGDTERTAILQYFDRCAAALGLSKDIAFVRHPREAWNRFLNQCKGIIGAESGTYFLERDDRTRKAVTAFLAHYPRATFAQVYDRFFKSYPNPVSGKAVSSRHFEPIGARTCQLLLEGSYNGILKADEHYISIRKDLSNIEDAVRRFKDPGYREAMVRRTYEYVLEEHTYQRRVQALIRAVENGAARRLSREIVA
jgi:hypothetical protein